MADVNKQISDINAAFADGSGISVGDMSTVVVIAVFALVFIIAISVVFKKLQAFQKDDNAFEVLRTVGIIFVAIIFVIIIANFVVI